MVKTLALSTTSYFSYTPDVGLIKREMAKEMRCKVEDLTPTETWDKRTAAENAKAEEVVARLQREEAEKPWIDKNVKGDASETGLLKFIAPLLEPEFNDHKDYPKNGLEGYRNDKPVLKNAAGDNNPYEIKFSSDIKFNLMIRDMAPGNANPERASDNLCVFLKGAPDRVHTRCSYIIENGKAVPMTDNHRTAIENANTLFGNMGERVLGFSRMDLDPKIYKKDQYFGTKDWKVWSVQKEYSAAARKNQGWFPMYGLTFVGLVSLNDPPRPGVDLAVQKCKAAGIKVIMVTGDQKNTAAAIAAKVSIITDKETEYNWLRNKGMSEEKAMEECKSIVIHGDELAAVNFKEEGLDDMEIEKGRKIMDWIRKPEVVFARTTPSQKLLIVNAC